MQNLWMKIISALEIVGGVSGILICPYMMFMSGFELGAMVIIIVFLAVFVLSLMAGIGLWGKTPFGRKASIAVQIIQLPKIISPGFIFMFSFGFDLFPHLTLVQGFSTIGFQFRFFVDSQLFFGSKGVPFLLGFSIPAMVALVKLWSYDPSQLDQDDQRKIDPPSPDEYEDMMLDREQH